MIEELRTDRPKDIGRACRILKLSRSNLHYRSVKDDKTVMEDLQRLSEEQPVEGFWKCYGRLRNEGKIINHKRLHRIYKKMNLPLRRKVILLLFLCRWQVVYALMNHHPFVDSCTAYTILFSELSVTCALC